MAKRFLKLKKFITALGFVMLFLWMSAFKSLADKDDYKMGFDDFLESDTDFFGEIVDEAKGNLETAQTGLRLVTEARRYMKISGQKWVMDRDSLSDELKGYIVEKTVYPDRGVPYISRGLQIPVPKDVDSKGFVGISCEMDVRSYNLHTIISRLESYIKKQEKTTDGLSTIYKGFTVVGSASVTGDDEGAEAAGKTLAFTVGSLSGGTILDTLRSNASRMYAGSGEYTSAIEDDTEAGNFEKMIAKPIGNGAFDLYVWMQNWNIDLTLDGLIFGRLSPTYKGTVDFTHFGMEENNPYGIVAATAYYVLRRMFLGVLPVIMMGILLRQLFQNGQKGRARLKEALGGFAFAIVLSFVAPYLIEICILVRDAALKYAALGMGAILNAAGLGSGIASNVLGLMYVTYNRNPTLLNALVWAASVGAGFVYLVTYIQIAMLLTGCVAVLPIVLFISIWNPKILKDWWNAFFPNLCVPLIDLILIQLPSVFLLLFKRNVKGVGGSMILGIIIIILMWNNLMIRDRVVKLLGFEGFARHSGGMIAAAAAIIRMASRDRKEGGKPDGKPDGKQETDSNEEAGFQKERGELQREALKDIGKETPGSDPEYDPSLGDSTDKYLKELDEEFKESGEEAADGISDEKGEPSYEESNGQDGPGELDTEEETGGMEGAYEEGVSPDDYTFADEDVPLDEKPLDPARVNMPDVDELTDTEQAGAGSGPAETLDFAKGEDYMQSPEYPARKPYLEDITPEHDDFREELSGAEKDRYDNLSRMDAYNEKIRQNEETMRSYGYVSERYEHDRAGFMEQENRLNAHMDASIARMNSGKLSKEEQKKEAENYHQMEQVKGALHDRVSQLDMAARLDKANSVYRSEVAAMAQTEKEYAKAWEIGGMSGRSYQNARDYRFQAKVDQAQKSLASYQNFDSKRFENILTPEEKENFYREREIHEKREKTVQMIAAGGRFVADKAVFAATVTAAAAGATLGAYGGSRTMMDVGMLTGTIGNVASSKVVKAGGYVARAAGKDYIDSPAGTKQRNDAPSSGSTPDTGTQEKKRTAPAGKRVTGTDASAPASMGRSARKGEKEPQPVRRKTGANNASPDRMGRRAGNGEKPSTGSGKRKGSGPSDPGVMGRSARNGEPSGKEKGNDTPTEVK